MIKTIYICDFCKMELDDYILKQRISFKYYEDGNIIDYNYILCNNCLKKLIEYIEKRGKKDD